MTALKTLKNRKNAVVSIEKITSAMKMISSIKLMKIKDKTENFRLYSDAFNNILSSLLGRASVLDYPPPLLVGRDKSEVLLLIVLTSNRGLCGSFNSNVVRQVFNYIKEQKKQFGYKIKLLCIGSKGDEQLSKKFREFIVKKINFFDKPTFQDASFIFSNVLDMFNEGEFDKCVILYNEFVSSIHQRIVIKQLVPFYRSEQDNEKNEIRSYYEYEPSEEIILNNLVEQNLKIQIYRAILESNSGEHSARMNSMDTATRNAQDVIKELDLHYNKIRQASITRELIEIISAGEAL